MLTFSVHEQTFKKAQAVEALTDPMVWLFISLMAIISVPNAAITSFSSILIKSFGCVILSSSLTFLPSGPFSVSAAKY